MKKDIRPRESCPYCKGAAFGNYKNKASLFKCTKCGRIFRVIA